MNSDHRRHRDFDQDNDRHEDHHSKIGKDATIAGGAAATGAVGAKASRNKNVKIIVMMRKIIEIMKIEVFNMTTKIIMN